MIRRPHSTPRSAFTLIELMVVVTIIALLMALILPAIQKVRHAGRRAQTCADISQLSAAAASFKQEFKFYPPDTFTIPTTKNASDLNNQILQRMYPRYALDQTNSGLASGLFNAGLPQMNGIQCLIYFTTGPENKGWAVDGPFSPGVTATTKKGPFFEYGGPPLTNYVYNDPFGTPYAYFASGAGGKYSSAGFTYTNPEGLTTTVKPYLSTGSKDKFVNSDSVQIISAGVNGAKSDGGFGPGGADPGTGFSTWTPLAGAYSDAFKPIFPGVAPNAGSGYDDMANFYSGKQLGAE